MRILLLLLTIIFTLNLNAQQVQLFEQFNGRFDFTAFGNTLNTAENGGGPCTILTQSSAVYTLEPLQTLVSARLYWAGSGSGDFDVTLNGTAVTAERTFAVNSQGNPFFAAYADVTSILQANGQGNYTLSDLDLTAVIPTYCGNGTNFGGWSIVVIYEDPRLTLNQIGLYDGLEFVSASNTSLSITIDNLNVASQDLAKIGFLAWEGDQFLANNESLRINGVLIDNPPLNPGDNAFNGTNSYTGSDQLFNMDLDFYDVANVLMVGDTSATIELTSNQDFVMINNVITSVNSENPDATITIDNLGVLCSNNNVDLFYTVSNTNSTSLLPAGTPIAFYRDGVLIGQSQTNSDIPIGGSESSSITFNFDPATTPANFTLLAVVDDDGTGTGVVSETDETNNEDSELVDFSNLALDLGPDIFPCENTDPILGRPLAGQFNYQWFLNGAPLAGETESTIMPMVSGTYTLEAISAACFATDDVEVTFGAEFVVNDMPSPLIICDDGSGMSCDTNTPNDGFGTFRLDDATLDITGGDPDLTVTYFGTRINAQNDQLPIPVDPGTGDILYCNDNAYSDIPVTDVLDPAFGTGGVWARVDSATNNCFEIVPLSLFVRDIPEVNTPSGPLRVCDDAVADGITTGIDLTQVETQILGFLSPDEYDIYYYQDQADAVLDGDAALASQPNPTFPRAIGMPDNFENASTPQTIYVLVVGNTMSTMPNNGTTGCYSIVSFELIVDPLPADNGPFELFECDVEVQGSTPPETAFFDLTQLEAAAITNPTDVVTWYANPMDESNDIEIPDPSNYENIATPETVIGRVTTEFGCSQTFTVTLRVLPNPDANTPDPIEICDGDIIAGDMNPDDGIGFFDLTQRDAQIIGTATDVTVLYFETLQEAIDNVAGTELVSPYENTTPGTQVVFARLTQDSPPATLACYSIVPLTLTVIALPDQPDSTFQDPLRACDDDGDGTAEFDLTAQDAAVIGSQDPSEFVMPITYYTSLADAQTPDNEIDPALTMAYPSTTGQTIWVRLENSTTGCARISSFTLAIDVPSAIGVGDDLFACDVENGVDAPDGIGTFDLTVNEGLINQGDFTLNLVYYASAADQAADNPIPALEVESYQNVVSPQQEIFVDVVNAQGCTAQTSFFINVETNPAAVSPMPIVACDDNNDGIFDMFDLEDPDLITEIENGETDVETSFYVSVVDAQTGDPLDVLPSPYENIVPFNQTIYARVTRNVPPGVNPCYTIVAVELQVAQLPNAPTSDFQDPLSVCDDGDGSVFFDLSLNTAPILDAQDDPSIITVGYYPSEADATAEPPTNAIMPDDAYESSGGTVWVRVENTTTGCFRILSFELVVEPLPVLGMAPFELLVCDDEVNGSAPDDGLATFDLTEANTIITDGNTSYAVFYYTSLANQAADNPIADPTSYQNLDAMGNIENPQDIFVTVQTAFGCEVETTLTLEVLPNPAAMTPDPFEICDGEGGPLDTNTSDGISIFDLTTLDATIIAGQPNVNVLYYESFELAEAADVDTEIQNPTEYQNTTPDEQVIYARVTRDVPPARVGCFTIVEVVLRVNPLPDDSGVISDLIICELIFDGVATFNLDEKDEEALNGQDPLIFDVQYFLDQPSAEAGSSPIINSDSFPNTVNPQEIFVGILNRDTGCYIGGLQSFFIEVRQDAVANQPTEPFVICDNEGDPRDGFASFDLSDTSNEDVEALNAIILGGQSDVDFTITYHETPESAEAGSPSISFPYTNVINPQRIYIRVTHTTGCFATSSMILQVDPSPDVVLEESYRICVDADGNLIPEEDGAPSPPTIDTGLDPSQYTFAWEIDGELQVGEINPFIVAEAAGTYTVTVTDSVNGCETTAETTVFMSSPPITFDAIVTSGAFASNHIIEATAEGEGTYEFQLDDGPFQDSGIFEDVSPGNHIVTIRDVNGCGSVEVAVSVIDYPRFVTPNQDGFNDSWNIIGIGEADPTAKIYIFDRYGKLLKQLSPLSNGWNGTYNGNPLPSSDYWFLVEYTEEETRKQFRGHFTLKR